MDGFNKHFNFSKIRYDDIEGSGVVLARSGAQWFRFSPPQTSRIADGNITLIYFTNPSAIISGEKILTIFFPRLLYK